MFKINRIKELREQNKLTLKQLANELVEKGYFKSITDGTLSRYESGTREPKLETWQKLADFFKVPIPYLQGITNTTGNISTEQYIIDSINQLDISKKDKSIIKDLFLSFEEEREYLQSQINELQHPEDYAYDRDDY